MMADLGDFRLSGTYDQDVLVSCRGCDDCSTESDLGDAVLWAEAHDCSDEEPPGPVHGPQTFLQSAMEEVYKPWILAQLRQPVLRFADKPPEGMPTVRFEKYRPEDPDARA